MTVDGRSESNPQGPSAHRVVSTKFIPAPPQSVFEMWTAKEHLLAWWGPENGHCTDAVFDLQIGGNYRIVNEFIDGSIIVILGNIIALDPPHSLSYTWRTIPGSNLSETVEVVFRPQGDGTEVRVIHERIADRSTVDSHIAGWRNCLDSLSRYAPTRAG